MQISFSINDDEFHIAEMLNYHKNGNLNTMRFVFFTPLDIVEGDTLKVLNLRGYTSFEGKVISVEASKNTNQKNVIITEPSISYNSED